MSASAENTGEAVAAKSRGKVRHHIFVSYSHEDSDTAWYKDVLTYLGQLGSTEEHDVLEIWDDTEIKPGEKWFDEINQKLESARAAILLLSPSFLQSSFIQREEIPKILERHANEGLIVHPLIGKPCLHDKHTIGALVAQCQLVHPIAQSLEEMEESERHRVLNTLVGRMAEQIGPLDRFGNIQRGEIMDDVSEIVGLELEREIATGDTSIVYRAENDFRELAVKAMVSVPVSETGQKELRAQIEKSQRLRSSTFIRLHKVDFGRHICALTTDFVPGYALRHGYQRLKHESRWNEVSWTEVVSNIILQLAEAVNEAHDAGICYLSLNPADIIIHEGNPRIYPVDFSTWLAVAGYSRGVLRFTLDSQLYMAPEYFDIPTGRQVSSKSTLGAEADLDTVHKADQYALGMNALAMLERARPLRLLSLRDLNKLFEFHRDPRRFASEGKQKLEDREWRRNSPALARVLWKMLASDPSDRWANMGEVAAQLHAVLATADSHAANAHVADAKASYNAIAGNDEFYQRFYDVFFDLSPDAKTQFEGTDWRKQRSLLDEAIERLLNFRASQREPTTLSRLVESHRGRGLTKEQFENFGKAFLATLEEAEAIDLKTRDAWEAVLWPGIDYMQRQCVDLD